MRRSAAILLIATVLAGAAPADVPIEETGRVERLPRVASPHWIFVADVVLRRSALVDLDRGAFLGMISTGYLSPSAAFPRDETYSVGFDIMSMEMPSVLHLPREGDGQWLISFQGTQLSLPVTNIVWQGNSYAFDMTLKFGQIGGDFAVKGSVTDAGAITGDFTMIGEGMALMQDFEGTRTGL